MDRAEQAEPRGYGRIAQNCGTLQTQHDLLEQLQPFRTDSKFEDGKARRVTARMRQAVDVAGAHRIGDEDEHNRHGTGQLLQRSHSCAASGQDNVRRERYQFLRVFADVIGIAGAPAAVDPHVAAINPAKLL